MGGGGHRRGRARADVPVLSRNLNSSCPWGFGKEIGRSSRSRLLEYLSLGWRPGREQLYAWRKLVCLGVRAVAAQGENEEKERNATGANDAEG